MIKREKLNQIENNSARIKEIYSTPKGSITQIIREFPSLDYDTVREYLVKEGFSIKFGNFANKMDYDKTYFKKIDSHEKAYWLGFIYADGNVHKNALQIVLVDKGHLDKFKVHIKAEQGVHEYKVENCSNINRFAIVCPEIVRDMNNLGVFERKSMILKFPDESIVPKQFIASFMLGYFDGDGSIVAYKPKVGNRKWNISVISTKHFCEKFNKILVDVCKLFDSKIIKYKRIPDKDIWEAKVCGVYSDRLERIYNFLYKDINFALERKREKIIEIIQNNPKEPYTSQYYGVSKSFKKWQVQVKLNGKMTRFGRFEKEEDAARHYDKILIENGLDLRYLNFPEEHNAK